jgi:hypothetical protein
MRRVSRTAPIFQLFVVLLFLGLLLPVSVSATNGATKPQEQELKSYPVWYLAEGTSDWGFDTLITIQNPNRTEVTAQITYMTRAGAEGRPDITLPAESQTVINPRDDLGAADFSTKVTCKQGKTICVDRRMTWTGPGAPSPEGHSSVGVTSPAKTWYLPEGSASWGFECWLLIQNPNNSEATCQITYMVENVGPRTVTKTIPANSRKSFNMADDMPDVAIKDASIKVEASLPVIPERAMYRNNRREGHDSIGTTTPTKDYYLAEGATGYKVGYITYVLVQNPNATPTNVNLTYQTQHGKVAGPSFTMPANSRKTIRVNDQLPPGTDVSTHVHGIQPIIAERAMYWGAGTPLGEACHDSIGIAAPHNTWYLPDGQTSGGYETYTLVQNPNAFGVEIILYYMTPTGTAIVIRGYGIRANSRETINMFEYSGIAGRAAVFVESEMPSQKIIVERAMYWNSRGAGTDTIGGYSDYYGPELPLPPG